MTLSRTHFEKANAAFVAEHNIINGLYCASKKQPMKPTAFTNISDVNLGNQNTINCWAKFYSRLFCVVSVIATRLRITATTLLSCIV